MRTTRQFPGLVVLAACVLAAAAGHAQEPRQLPVTDPLAVPRISQKDFHALLADGKAYVIDVRSAVSFVAGHIPGAASVPYEEMLERADDTLTRAGERTIVTYCSCPSEHTAAEAGLILLARGGRDVRALTGGYIDWVRGGGRVERAMGGGGRVERAMGGGSPDR